MEDGAVLGKIPITISPYTFKLKQIYLFHVWGNYEINIFRNSKKLNQPETLYSDLWRNLDSFSNLCGSISAIDFYPLNKISILLLTYFWYKDDYSFHRIQDRS